MNYGAGIITTRSPATCSTAPPASTCSSSRIRVRRGGAGLLTGAVDYIIDGAASSLPLIKSGQFRRSPSSTTVRCRRCPMFAMSEAAGCRSSTTCRAGLRWLRRPERRARSSTGLQSKGRLIYADPATNEKLVTAGINPCPQRRRNSTPLPQEAVRWSTAFKESGIKLD